MLGAFWGGNNGSEKSVNVVTNELPPTTPHTPDDIMETVYNNLGEISQFFAGQPIVGQATVSHAALCRSVV